MAYDGEKMMMMSKEPVYNETLNPRQIDYPNVLGFNDLHIHAIRHLDVKQSHGPADHLLQTIVHHHCKVYDDNTASCLLFPYGMTDQDKPTELNMSSQLINTKSCQTRRSHIGTITRQSFQEH